MEIPALLFSMFIFCAVCGKVTRHISKRRALKCTECGVSRKD